MESPKSSFSNALLAQKIPGGRAAVSNALSRLRQGYGRPRDNAFHLPNPLCSESGNPFRRESESVAGRLSLQSLALPLRPSKEIKVNWTALTFEEDRCVHAFVRLPRRARNNSIARVTCLPTRKLSLFPWDRRWESPGWIHQTRRSRLCFPRREIRP